MGKKERKVQVTTLNTSGKKVSKAYSHYNLNATDTDIKTFATTMNMLSENKLKKVEYTDRENITDERAALTVSFSLDAFETTFWQEVKTDCDAERERRGWSEEEASSTDTAFCFTYINTDTGRAVTDYAHINVTFGEMQEFLAADNPSQAFAELMTTKLSAVGLSMTYDSGTFTLTNTGGGDRIKLESQSYGLFDAWEKLYTAWTNGVYSDKVKAVRVSSMSYYLRIDTEGVADGAVVGGGNSTVTNNYMPYEQLFELYSYQG